jgi:hypothetical protein
VPIYPFNEPFRPATNNCWYLSRKTDRVIVFVHGVLSNSAGCWYKEPEGGSPGVYWPDLLKKDERFSEYSLYLGGYETGIKSGPYEVRNCFQELCAALERPGKGDEEGAVLDRDSILFVCHSMGGIVVRYMLTARTELFRSKKIGLALIASPSYGAAWAKRLGWLAKYFKNEQGAQLEWGSSSLQDLDSRFKWLMQDRSISRLSGSEACEHYFLLHGKYPPMAPLVNQESAGRYFGPVRMLPKTDHFSCVKPDNDEHPAYQFLYDFVRTFERDVRPHVQTADAFQNTQATTGVITTDEPVCRRFHWDVTIDEEGDAYNEMTFEGIVLPADGTAVYTLPPAEVQTGHTSHYELVWDERTSPGIRLETTESDNKILTTVVLPTRPAKESPAELCVRSYDWNAYSMNMEEYSQKPGWREDGVDYAEKSVPERWGAFSVLIRFPRQMVFAKRPFLEICDYSRGSEQRKDPLSAKYRDCFYFSPALNCALLNIQEPEWPLSYRVSWLLGESPSEDKAALLPRQKLRQRTFAQRLLHMREEMKTPPVKAETRMLIDGVNSTLASIAEYIQQEVIGGVELDPLQVELSLMVLDDVKTEALAGGGRKFPVLRIVAATNIEGPIYAGFSLFVGNGNAGRAWKSRATRVFDHDEKDPKRHIYVSRKGVQPHSFLISVPLLDPDSAALVYGIVNIGTFSDDFAAILRPLGAAHEIEKLTAYAQSYVLQQLLDALKIEPWQLT